MNVTETFRGFSAQRSLPRDGERTELHALTLPLDVERTKTVRSGPSGSAIHMELHAQARVAVPTTRDCTLRAEWQHALTLPLDVERTEDVALAPDDLAYAKAVALPRAVPGHPRLAGPMTSSGNVPL